MAKVFIQIILTIVFVSCKTKKPVTDANTEKQNNEPKIVNGLIQDCPEELIINAMPSDNPKPSNNRYYIYQGFRKEIKDFDSTWVKNNCKVKTTVAQ